MLVNCYLVVVVLCHVKMTCFLLLKMETVRGTVENGNEERCNAQA